MSLLLPAARGRASPIFVDATFGAGGHTAAILARCPAARVIALDTDPAAATRARELEASTAGRVIPVHANFAQLGDALDALDCGEVDGIMYDLGLSSLQLSDLERGFAFSGTGALDMRLDPSSEAPTAATLLATLKEGEIADIIFEYGDERNARRIAHQIVRRRERSPLRSTSDLVAAVLSAQPRSKRRTAIHPATRTFLALRMAVNRELESLEQTLSTAIRYVRPGGRIAVISFHSGEDRVVKRQFAAWRVAGLVDVLTRKPLTPSALEIAANPRSRSAKLRAAQRSA
jgi:16S rRNA (cytosine1402-N4)-methyltransferase